MDDGLAMMDAVLHGLPLHASLPDMVFFHEIRAFIDDELIHEYLPGLGRRVMRIAGGLGTILLSLWITVQGYRMVTGRSREPMMALVAGTLRTTFIAGIAMGMAVAWGPLYASLTDGLARTVDETMTGNEDGHGAYGDIDRTLAIMQAALTAIDTVDSHHDAATETQKGRALLFTGVGLGLPAMAAATAMLVNKLAIGLVLALGPAFILCLLFEQTRPLFQKWLMYGIGTLFSMALLTVMVTLALDMVIAVGTAFWIGSALGAGSESVTSMAMQQGGLGLILTALIVGAPPMAAMFFNGLLGQFSPFSVFGQGGSVGGRRRVDAGQPFHPVAHREADPVLAHDPVRYVAGPEATATDEIKRRSGSQHAAPATPAGRDGFDERRAGVERQLWQEILEIERNEDWWQATSLAGRGGGALPRPPGAIPIARNGGYEAAMEAATDITGLVDMMLGTRTALAQMTDALAADELAKYRDMMTKAGVPDVPMKNQMAWVTGGALVLDYHGTLDTLVQKYRDHLQDQRLRETWGDHYRDIRIGKSKMTVQEFERRVYEVHQKAVDAAYDKIVAEVTRGERTVINGYARTVGSAMDEQVRNALREFARLENINDSPTSNLWAINRRLLAEDGTLLGYPDSRFGRNLYLDTTLALKGAHTRQLRRWNETLGFTVVVRPTQLGGSYVVQPIPYRRGGR